MSIIYEVHIAADKIDSAAKADVLKLGFKSNEFIRHQEVSESMWRATFKGPRRHTDKTWRALVQPLLTSGFDGTIIEELFDSSTITRISNSSSGLLPKPLPRVPSTQVPDGERKACDIHISVDLKNTSAQVLGAIESLGRASVDRAPEGTKRIYTITCEDLQNGHDILRRITAYLEQVPSLHCKIYLEEILRYERQPSNAPVLKRVSLKDGLNWLRTSDELVAL